MTLSHLTMADIHDRAEVEAFLLVGTVVTSELLLWLVGRPYQIVPTCF